jgi:hypothetical protein
VDGDVCEEMCTRNSGGEEKSMQRQQVTGDGFGCVCEEHCEQ